MTVRKPPKDFSEVSLGTYKRVHARLLEKSLPLAKQSFVLSEVYGMSMDEVRVLNPVEAAQMVDQVAWLLKKDWPRFEAVSEFQFTDPDDPQQKTTWFVSQDISKEEFGTWMDLEASIDQAEANNLGIYDAVPMILAIFCRPQREVGQPYNGEKAVKRSKLMEGLPMDIAEGVATFFLTRNEALTIKTAYFMAAYRRLTRERQTSKNGNSSKAGLRHFWNWPMETLRRQIISSLNGRLKSYTGHT